MQAIELGKSLLNYTVATSGIEHRAYLGMSAIGQCSRQLYLDLVQGRQFSTQSHLYCHLGYLFEASVLNRLKSIGSDLLGPAREFSDFHGRFRGHSDGVWDGDLLEIKSTTEYKLRNINGRIPHAHYWQIQTYMYYGQYRHAQVVYIARDTGRMHVVRVPYSDHIAELARLKAAAVLEAVDQRQIPDCECGRCHSE